MNFLLIIAVEHSLFVIQKYRFRRNKKSIPKQSSQSEYWLYYTDLSLQAK